MKDFAPQNDLQACLAALAHSSRAGARVQKAAGGLLDRLSRPVLVGVIGPDATARAQLTQQIEAAGDRHAALRPGSDYALWSGSTEEAEGKYPQLDLVVWATQDFGAAEQAAWAPSPDRLKDHSMLAIFHDDPSVHLLAEDRAGDGFVDFFAFGTIHHDLTGLAASVLERVHSGRLADADVALALVQKHGVEGVASFEKPEPAAAPIGSVFGDALQILDQCSARLSQLSLAETAVDDVLAICVETSDELAAKLGTSEGKSQIPEGLQDDALDAADKIVLMSLEGDIGSAVDAVHVLSQIGLDLQRAAQATP